MTNVKPLPAGKTYELWIVTENKGKLAGGLVQPDNEGNFVMETRVPTDAGAVLAAAFTDEPAGGMPDNGATGQVQFLGSVAAK